VVQVRDNEEALLLQAASEAEMRHFPAALWSMTRCSTARMLSAPRRRPEASAFAYPAPRYQRRFARSCEDGGGDDARCCFCATLGTPNLGLWHLPGSIVRKGESAKRAVMSGVREEVGYDLPAGRGRRLVVDLSGDEAHKFFYQSRGAR
jgi:hypothetical protein